MAIIEPLFFFLKKEESHRFNTVLLPINNIFRSKID